MNTLNLFEIIFFECNNRYGALNPMNFLEGAQLYTSAVKASSNTRGDFENYIARLNAIPQQVGCFSPRNHQIKI